MPIIARDTGICEVVVPRIEGLEQAGYLLRVREPDWFEHRCFTGTDPTVNLHVFSPGSPEIERMLLFRDWLRTNPVDRELY